MESAAISGRSTSPNAGSKTPAAIGVMSRDSVSRCLETSLHFWECSASRLVMVAPSSPVSRPWALRVAFGQP